MYQSLNEWLKNVCGVGIMLINQQYPSECNLFASRTGASIDFANCINAVIAPYGLPSSQVTSSKYTPRFEVEIGSLWFAIWTRSNPIGTFLRNSQTQKVLFVSVDVQSTIKKYGYNVKTQTSMLGTCIEQPQTTPGLQSICNIKNSATDLAVELSLSN